MFRFYTVYKYLELIAAEYPLLELSEHYILYTLVPSVFLSLDQWFGWQRAQ